MSTVEKISLLPVCVGNGDAIFITLEYTDGTKQCYLVDGSRGGGEMKSLTSHDGPVDITPLVTEDSPKLRMTYLKLVEQGYKLKGIIVTHPHQDHYKGIHKLVEQDVACPAILLTDQFFRKAKQKNVGEFLNLLQKNKYSGNHVVLSDLYSIFPQAIFSFDCPFSSLVLYRRTDGAIERPKERRVKKYREDNETSIIVTITDPHTKKPLALLTGDADFTKRTQNVGRDIPLVLVPHHGSKNNSDKAFYESCTADTYLISCGTHEGYNFPHNKVIKDICDATTKACTIFLTSGKHLKSDIMSKVDPVTYLEKDISICYWDKYLHESRPWLDLCLCPAVDQNFTDNTIEWSLDGYEKMASTCVEQLPQVKTETICVALKYPQNGTIYYLKVEENDLSLVPNRTEVEVIYGLPSPLEPCNWDPKTMTVTMKLKGRSIFLQVPNCTKEKYNPRFKHNYFIFKCHEVPWKMKYFHCNGPGRFVWSKKEQSYLKTVE